MHIVHQASSFYSNANDVTLESAYYGKFNKENMKMFDVFWNELLKELATKKKIKNWTTKNGYLGGDFTAQATSNNDIECITVEGSINNARKVDFELIFDNWEGYVSERIPRTDFKKSFVTKYTISIIHQYLK
jgi:hypothetical protein